jgi:hypothetical protein
MKHNIQISSAGLAPVPITVSLVRRTSGSLLTLSSPEETAYGLSDPVNLNKFAEVEIRGLDGGKTLYLLTPDLISQPQIIIGYHAETGEALLVGALKASRGNIAVIGQSQSGKSTWSGLIAMQLLRLGYFAAGASLKDTDPNFVASMKSGADDRTRLDSNNNLVAAPFALLSLKPNEPTNGCNYLLQNDPDRPLSIRAGELLLALGQGGSEKDPTRRFFEFSQLFVLLLLTDFGQSFRELYAKLKALKLDRDTRYAAAALFHEVAQLAAIEAANLPEGHPANIDLIEMIKGRGAVYLSACYQDVGAVAIAWAGLMIKAIVSAKRKLDPSNQTLIWVFIDEAQLFPLPFLKQLIEQCAANGIRLLIAFHNLDQFKDDWESLCMMQVQIIFSAAPGSSTARYVEYLFGTKKEYIPSFSNSDGTSDGITHSSGPLGDSVAISNSVSANSGVTLTEREVLRWGPNNTLALNFRRGEFIYYQNPGAELAQWPTAVVGRRCPLHISVAEIKRLTHEAIHNTPNTILPGRKAQAPLALPALPPELEAKRLCFLEAFNNAATRIRKAIA